MEINIRKMEQKDIGKILEIYKNERDNVSCSNEIPNVEQWDNKYLKGCRIIAEINNTIIGWTALMPVSTNCIYSGVAEVSCYISSKYHHKGIGTKLLKEIIKISEENGIWTIEGEILQENIPSLGLALKNGFRLIGYREKISKDKNGKWQNIILVERRSCKDNFTECFCGGQNDN